MVTEVQNSLFKLNNSRGDWRVRTQSRPSDERGIKIRELHGLLMIIEVMLSGELQRFAKHTYNHCIENGLYKQNEKRLVNQLLSLADGVQFRSTQMDAEMIMGHIYEVMPCYASRYIKEGGGTVTRFQQAITEDGKNLISQFYLAVKNMVDKHKVEYSEYCASLLTVAALSKTGIEVYETIKKQQNMLMTYGGLFARRKKSEHHERVIKITQEILQLHIRDINAWKGTREEQVCRGFLKQLQQVISGESLNNICNRIFTTVAMEYAEFALACICLDIHQTGGIPKEADDVLRLRYGIENTNGLEEELRRVSITDDMDIWDVMEALPNSNDRNKLEQYRTMCIERPDLPRSCGEQVKIDA